jgi:hypothetical protein
MLRIRSRTVPTIRLVSTAERTAWSISAVVTSASNWRAILADMALNESASSANSSLLETVTGWSNSWFARRRVPSWRARSGARFLRSWLRLSRNATPRDINATNGKVRLNCAIGASTAARSSLSSQYPVEIRDPRRLSIGA